MVGTGSRLEVDMDWLWVGMQVREFREGFLTRSDLSKMIEEDVELCRDSEVMRSSVGDDSSAEPV